MKTLKKLTKKSLYFSLLIALMLGISNFIIAPKMSKRSEATNKTEVKQTETQARTPNKKEKKIKIALLLDTSNSMDGLINQAKSQLWRIVNELSLAKCEGEKPQLQIALYEYGNDWLSGAEGYIRQVSGFTGDLDLISEKLFALRTNGGNEFCGQVIDTSLNQLDWNADGNDLQIIFIAGNEPFTQGKVSYRKSCSKAKEKNVIVNTIFCGNYEEGIATNWKDGADIANGSYMSIEQNSKTVYVATPYDDRITALNSRLNDTYVVYGAKGKRKKENQITQDSNAVLYGKQNSVQRTVFKSKHFYKNTSWDMVDACEEKDFDIAKIKTKDLPEEMRNMTLAEKKKYIEKKRKEREAIQKEISELNQKRIQYIAKQQKNSDTNTLESAMIKAIKKQAMNKNFVFE